MEPALPSPGSDLQATLSDRIGSGSRAAPGERLGQRYLVTGDLGAGGNGTVVSAVDLILDREVAVKISNSPSGVDERIAREARLTARIEHSHVVPIHDMEYLSNGGVLFSMRRVAGTSLGEILRCQDNPEGMSILRNPAEVITIIRKVCDAVGRAHERGIVHCDVKPDNIMLGRHGEVFVVDWGEAADLREKTGIVNRIHGTPAYMAPEQARAEPPTPSSDVYAIGATLFHLLYGRFPLNMRPNETIDDLLRRRASGELDSPSPTESARIPVSLESIVLRSLAPVTANRYPNAEALGKALADWQDGRLDSWDLLLEQDFSDGSKLDARFAAICCDERDDVRIPCPERIEQRSDRIVIGAFPHRTYLRWNGGIAEDSLIEVSLFIDEEGKANLDLCVCGDPMTGYRLRVFGQDHVELESIRGGRHEIFGRWPGRLPVGRVLLAIGHSDSRIWVQANGRTIIEAYDPLPPRGSEFRTVAVGRLWDAYPCHIFSIRLWTRRPPLVISVLEVGKHLLRAGHSADAAAWFTNCMHRDLPPAILHEAAFLSALASGTDRFTRLRSVAHDSSNPYAMRALGQMIVDLATQGDPAYSAELLLGSDLTRDDEGLRSRVASLLLSRLHGSDPSQKLTLLAALARIPIRALDISSANINDLSPLSGMSLQRLIARNNAISDVRPISCSSLEMVDVSYNCISDLFPLSISPLKSLRARGNPCFHLPEFANRTLQHVDIAQTNISDISSLYGQPLKHLNISESRVFDLSSVRASPLVELIAERCDITDAQPLYNVPLSIALVAGTGITDATPLASPTMRILDLSGCPVELCPSLKESGIHRLLLRATRIRDLSPLHGSSLRFLNIAGCHIENLLPLRGLPLNDLILDSHSADFTPISDLPLRRLCLMGAISSTAMRIVSELHIESLELDLREINSSPIIGRNVNILTINGFDASFVRSLHPVLQHAFAGDANGLLACSLESHGRRILPIPQPMRRDEAMRLASAAGATLLSLPDLERQHCVYTSLLPIASSILPTTWFHCGLQYNGSEVRWNDGSAFRGTCGADSRLMASPDLTPLACLHQRPLKIVGGNTNHVPILEWVNT